MFLIRKKAIIGGLVLAVLAAIALSWGFAANGESSGAAAGGNWGSVPLFTVIVGIFGVLFSFSQTYTIFMIRQLNNRMAQMDTRLTNQMAQMDTRLTNQIAEMDKRMNERFALMEDRFTQLENRMDNRFAQMEERFTQLESRVDNRISRLESQLDNIQQNYVDDMKYHLREE